MDNTKVREIIKLRGKYCVPPDAPTHYKRHILVQLLKQGYSAEHCSSVTGYSRSHVRRVARDLGIPVPARGADPVTERIAIYTGMSIRQAKARHKLTREYPDWPPLERLKNLHRMGVTMASWARAEHVVNASGYSLSVHPVPSLTTPTGGVLLLTYTDLMLLVINPARFVAEEFENE